MTLVRIAVMARVSPQDIGSVSELVDDMNMSRL